ncbi:MAG: cytochrome c peroxidase [Bacteroidota bacterium]
MQTRESSFSICRLAGSFILPVSAFLFLAVSCGSPEKNVPVNPADTANKVDIRALAPVVFGQPRNLPADNPATKQGIALGRALFYEPLLSADNTISCASCHKPELAFTDGKAFSEGVGKQLGRRSSMSLQNLAWQKDYFWDGRASSLEEQSVFPITDAHEMNQTMGAAAAKLQGSAKYPPMFKKAFGTDVVSPLLIQRALAQFERTLISGNSRYDKYLAGTYTPTTQEALGMSLFFTHPTPGNSPQSTIRGANCGDCHINILTSGTTLDLDGFRNNGISRSFNSGDDYGLEEHTGSSADRGKFKIPALRNIALTSPYMHNGMFSTLEQVVDHYNSDSLFNRPGVDPLITGAYNSRIQTGKLGLTTAEKQAIVSFLHMLTDSTFVSDTAYKAPSP